MIRIHEDHNGLTVYRYDVIDAETRIYWTHEGKRKEVKINDLDRAPWWLLLDHADAQALVSAIGDYGAVQTPEYAYMEGELKATKLHLQDMRKLAILEPPTGDPA